MLLIPLTFFSLTLTGAAWSFGVRAWIRSQEVGLGIWFRVGLQIRACILCVLSLLPLALSAGSLWLGWLWFNRQAGQGALYWGELAIGTVSLLLVLLALVTLIRYERAGVPIDSMLQVILQMVATLLYPFIVNLCWPLTGVSTLLFLILGGLLLWFHRRLLRRVTLAGTSLPGTSVSA